MYFRNLCSTAKRPVCACITVHFLQVQIKRKSRTLHPSSRANPYSILYLYDCAVYISIINSFGLREVLELFDAVFQHGQYRSSVSGGRPKYYYKAITTTLFVGSAIALL